MDLAFSTNAYIFFPLMEAIRRIKNCGYQGVEILTDVPHAFPQGLSPGHVIEIGRTLEQTGLIVSNINANTALGFQPSGLPNGDTPITPSLCIRDNEIRKKRIQYTKRTCRIKALPVKSGGAGYVNASLFLAHLFFRQQLVYHIFGVVDRNSVEDYTRCFLQTGGCPFVDIPVDRIAAAPHIDVYSLPLGLSENFVPFRVQKIDSALSAPYTPITSGFA